MTARLTPIGRFVTACCELSVNRFAVQHGLTSGEVSRKKAIALYGSWFRSAIESGRLRPCRIGDGKNGTRWYSVDEILRLRAEDEAPGELVNFF